MSPVDALFAMRSSGSTRLSAAIAGSSEGKTLSVTAMIGLGIHSPRELTSARPQVRCHPSPAGGGGRRGEAEAAGWGAWRPGRLPTRLLAIARSHPPPSGEGY